MNLTRLALLLLAAASLLVAGCASTPDYNAKPAYAKALPDPDRLMPAKDMPGALSWMKPGNDFSRYHSLLIERIAVQLDPASSIVQVPAVALRRLERRPQGRKGAVTPRIELAPEATVSNPLPPRATDCMRTAAGGHFEYREKT